MPIHDLYSKRRQDNLKGTDCDVYQYEEIPGPLRVQMRRIIIEGLGSAVHAGRSLTPNSAYRTIYDILCREYGLDHIGTNSGPYADLMYFMDRCSTDQFLDVVELACRMIDKAVRHQDPYVVQTWSRTTDPDELLEEVNYRCRRAGVGYEYAGEMLVRVDSQFLHAEATKPALRLLSVPGYDGPEEEFLTAHEHFRHGRHKEAITEATKSFESMMKAICDRKGWDYQKGARATDLVKVLRKNHLWPEYLDGSFDQLIATLQSGLPQVRNDRAAHGQGATPQEVPEYVAAYALHLAASKIVLLADAAASVPDVVAAGAPTERENA